MDFESFLQSEALRPLSIVYSRALLDTPETASVIARLPPPKIALLYHAALMHTRVEGESCQGSVQTTEALCARIVAAYGLENDGSLSYRSDQRHLHAFPTTPTVQGATASAESLAVLASDRPHFFFPLPPLCRPDVKKDGGAFQHLEHAMARRELDLQLFVLEAMLAKRADAA